MLLTPANRKQSSPALLLQPRRNQNYFDRVTAADRLEGDLCGLESSVIRTIGEALDQLHYAGYLGVSSGIFAQAPSIIKASCFLCGARTLTGILTPLAEDMPVPTNVNFVPADYNRKLGLGDPVNATKYLNTNRNNNADPQNSNTNLVYITQAASATSPYMSASSSTIETGDNNFGRSANTLFFRNRRGSVLYNAPNAGTALGVIGTARNNSSNFTAVWGSNTLAITSASQTPYDNNLRIFARVSQAGVPSVYGNQRISFYVIGEYVSPIIIVPILDLFNANIQSAIP